MNHHPNCSRISICSLVVLLVMLTAPAFSMPRWLPQDSPPATATEATQDDQATLSDLQRRWSELQIQFAAKAAEISEATGDPTELQNQYNQLLTQADQTIDQIKQVSLRLIEKDANDRQALRSLMGVLVHLADNANDLEVLDVGQQLIEKGISPAWWEAAARINRLSIDGREIFEELLIRQREFQADDLPRVKLVTNKGEIVIELFEDQAPNTIANFITLIESGHFAEVSFHRVIDGFMAQAGQQRADGEMIDLGYTIACECYVPDTRRHFSHSVSMALAGRDSGSGQFFLNFARTKHLDGKHTCFGRIISGADVLSQIQRTQTEFGAAIEDVENDKIVAAEVIRKRDHDYRVKKMGDPEPATTDDQSAVPTLTPPTSDAGDNAQLPPLPGQGDNSDEKKEDKNEKDDPIKNDETKTDTKDDTKSKTTDESGSRRNPSS